MASKKESLRKIGLYALVGVLGAFISLGVYAGAQYFSKKEHSSLLDNPAVANVASKSSSPQDAEGIKHLRKASEGFREAVRIAGPAVVNIKSTKGTKKKAKPNLRGRRRPMPPSQEDEENPFFSDPLFDFFRGFGQPFPEMDMPQTSLGSGFIIDKKGYIVTNNHVVQDANEILVSLANEKTEIKAKLVGTDPKTDLAVLKMETTRDLPIVGWADAGSIEVGDWVLAIGSPFDLRQTVTQGIISAKGRSSTVIGGDFLGDFIQTDAAINPGNSGGPLVDLEGQVVGVNTAIYSKSGGNMGIGFAIPSNLAKEVVQKLISDGKIVRGWLGVLIQPLTESTAKDLGIKEGVSVHEVMPDSPAEKAGLRAGDTIVEVDGKAVSEVTELQKLIKGFAPGKSFSMKVIGFSDKKTRTVTVKVGEEPEDQSLAKTSKQGGSEPDKLGAVVVDRKGKEGVQVQNILPGSYADSVGLEVGDVILTVNRTKVSSVSAYQKALERSKEINLEVERKGRKLFYSFVLPE